MKSSKKDAIIAAAFFVCLSGLFVWFLSIRFSTENQYFDLAGVYGPTPDCNSVGHKGEDGTVTLLENIRFGKTMCSFNELRGGEIKKVSGYFVFDNPEGCIHYPDMHMEDINKRFKRGEPVEAHSFMFKKLAKDQIEISINNGPMQKMTRCLGHED